MNATERALVDYLSEIKPAKIGFISLKTDVPGWCADIDLDGRYSFFAPQCIFDDCSDAQAKQFLEGFLKSELAVGWSVSEQLCKLLSKRGSLVSSIMDQLLTSLDWTSCSTHQLFLSYLSLLGNGAKLALKFLGVIPDDARDGLFLACHLLQSEELDRKLMHKFVEWEAGPTDFASTGHVYALQQFIAKWLSLYPYRDLEVPVRIYFKYQRDD